MTSSQLRLPAESADGVRASATELRVMTFNVQHAAAPRARSQAAWLARAGEADIVVLTEVGHGPGRVALLDALADHGFHVIRSAVPDQADYTTEIATRFGNAHAFATGVTTLPHRILAIQVRSGVHTPTVIGLYVPSRGTAARRNKAKRAFQTAVVAALPDVIRQADPGGPIVVTGDLNVVEPGHRPHYRVFGDWEYDFYRTFERCGLVDAFRLLHPEESDHSWFGHGGNGYRFDHLFVSAGHAQQVVRCQYIHTPRLIGLTDHAVLAAAVHLNPTQP